MITRLLLFLAVCISAIAQTLTVNDTAFVGSLTVGTSGSSTFYPSNIATMISDWIADNALTNSSSEITNIPDVGVNGYNLTNTAATKMPILTNNVLNGHAIAFFDGSNDYLKSESYTNSWPHEVWMYAFWGSSAISKYFFDGAYPSNRHYFQTSSGSGAPAQINAGANLGTSLYSTNFNLKYIVWTLVYNGSQSQIISNNVVIASGNAGSNNMSGIIWGQANSASGGGVQRLAEAFTFSATNNAVNRSNCFWYLTNKYGGL